MVHPKSVVIASTSEKYPTIEDRMANVWENRSGLPARTADLAIPAELRCAETISQEGSPEGKEMKYTICDIG